MKKMDPKVLLRNLAVEILIYSILIGGYYLLVLRYLGDWLNGLFHQDLTIFAAVGLGMILFQAFVLDLVTSLLMKYIKLDQFGIRRFLDVFSNR
jgi:hypothetical protein